MKKIYIVRDSNDEFITEEAYTSIMEAQRAIVAKILVETNTFTFDCRYGAICHEYIVSVKMDKEEEEVNYFIKELSVVDGNNEE